MRYDTIRLEVAEGVATITLARPDAYNALTLALARELFGAVLEVDEDPAVRCVVLTGAGRPSAAAATSRTSRRTCRGSGCS